jgi:hypothetical protein
MSVSRLTRTATFARALTWSSLVFAALSGLVLRPHSDGAHEATRARPVAVSACDAALPRVGCSELP